MGYLPGMSRRFRGTSFRRKRVSYCFWVKPRAHGCRWTRARISSAPPPSHHVNQTRETYRGRLAGNNGRRSNGASGRLGGRSEPDTRGRAFKYSSGHHVRRSGSSDRHVVIITYNRESLAPESFNVAGDGSRRTGFRALAGGGSNPKAPDWRSPKHLRIPSAQGFCRVRPH